MGCAGEIHLYNRMGVVTTNLGAFVTAPAALAVSDWGHHVRRARHQAQGMRRGRNLGGSGTLFLFTQWADQAGGGPVNPHLLRLGPQMLHELSFNAHNKQGLGSITNPIPLLEKLTCPKSDSVDRRASLNPESDF